MLYTLQPGCPHSRGSPLHCAPGVDGVWCTFERTIPRQKSSLPQAKSSFRHHPIWCRANRHHSNAPPSMFFATARQKRRWYHHIRPPPDARWTNVESGRMLYPPPSLSINVFLLLLFWSIEKIFLWKYINVCRHVEFLAHRARVDSNLWNLDRVCRHVEVHHVPVQWAGGGWCWC